MTKKKDISKEEISKLINEGKRCKDILNILSISKSTLYVYMRKYKLSFPKIKLYFDNTVFDSIDNEEKAYWLGFLYADGFVNGKYNNSVELSLKADDYEHLEKFNTFLKNKHKIKISKSSKGFTRCRCVITDKHFHDRLIELGCIPNKSTNLTFPDLSIFSDTSLVYDFIRGYVDGDGSITNTFKENRLRLEILGTKEFLEGIIKIFKDKFNKISSTRSSKNGINNFRIICSCSKADEVCKILYLNSTIYLDRKFKKFAELCNM